MTAKQFKTEWKKKITDYFYDHPMQKEVVRNAWMLLVTAFSAFIFALGYKLFLVPTALIETKVNGVPAAIKIVSGGMSGISQVILMFISLFPGNFLEGNLELENNLFSILYFVLNIPIMVVAFVGVGKRFGIYTIINVALSSLFSSLLGRYDYGWINEVATFCANNGGLLSRALLAGVCTGIASGTAYKIDTSSGGIDVIAYFISLRKGSMAGKYSLFINIGTLVLFTLFGSLKIWMGLMPVGDYISSMQYISGAFYSVIYMGVTSIVIDKIHLRNKKHEIKVVSNNPNMGKILIANLPHAATLVKAEGAYSGAERYVITMVVSSYEVKTAVKVAKEADPSAFIEVMDLRSVAGRFFLPPIR